MTTRMRAAFVVAAILVTSCRQEGDQRTETLDPVEARERRERLDAPTLAQLDSGSAAFRAHDYGAALGHYEAVVARDSMVAAAWFGIYMAQTALGDERAAKEAYDRARAIEPSASLLDPSEGASP